MSTRVTSSMLTTNYLRSVNRNLNNMKALQNQLSSGSKIQKASDNPYVASRSMQLNAEISYNKQFNENIKDTSNWLDTTDTALAQAGNVFGRIETLLVNAGDGAYGDDERIAIQDEVKEKVNELSQILNTSFEGSYIFGGTKTNSKPTIVVNGVLQYSDNSGSEIKISAYKDSSGKITSASGSANTLITPTPTLTDAQKQTLIDERDNSSTTDDRKQDITKVLQGTTPLYYDAASKFTTEPYANKQITLDATEVKNLQKELNGLDYTNAANDARIDDINSMLYNNSDNGTGTLSLANIKTYQQDVKNSTATKTEVDALSGASKFTYLNQINSNLKVDVSQGISTSYNKTAVDVMEFTDKNGKAINVPDLINNIIRDLGTNGNTSYLSTTYLNDIQSVTANLLKKRSEVGTLQNRMESAQSNNETQNYNMTDILSKTEDVDFSEASMNYSTMQTVYTASLQTSAKVLPMTILNYL